MMREITDKQIERNRIKLMKALRGGEYTQCKTNFFSGDAVCFVGLSFKVFSLAGDGHPDADDFHCLDELLGFEYAPPFGGSLGKFVSYNDCGTTFPELADILVKDYGFPDVQVESP